MYELANVTMSVSVCQWGLWGVCKVIHCKACLNVLHVATSKLVGLIQNKSHKYFLYDRISPNTSGYTNKTFVRVSLILILNFFKKHTKFKLT